MAQKRRKPEEELFCTFYKEYKRDIYRFLYSRVKNKEIAEDLTSETFLKVLFAIQNGMYVEKGNPKSWITTIAYNLMISHFRKNKIKHCFEIPDVVDISKGPASLVESKDLVEAILRFVETLNPAQRDIFITRVFGDEKFREIADRTGAKSVTLRVNYIKAIRVIKKVFRVVD